MVGQGHISLWWRALLGMSLVAPAVIGVGSAAAAPPTALRSPSPPVSGTSATVTIDDGLTPSGSTVKPFRVQLTVKGISFPTREGGNQALPGNVFVHVTVAVKNLANEPRLVPFNGSELRTLAIGTSHAIPAEGVGDPACTPPALDGLRTDQQVSDQVAAQWCVVAASTESVTLRPHKTKNVTFSGDVVSQTDAKADNFAVIYSPSDAARPTILPVGPGGVASTVAT